MLLGTGYGPGIAWRARASVVSCMGEGGGDFVSTLRGDGTLSVLLARLGFLRRRELGIGVGGEQALLGG